MLTPASLNNMAYPAPNPFGTAGRSLRDVAPVQPQYGGGTAAPFPSPATVHWSAFKKTAPISNDLFSLCRTQEATARHEQKRLKHQFFGVQLPLSGGVMLPLYFALKSAYPHGQLVKEFQSFLAAQQQVQTHLDLLQQNAHRARVLLSPEATLAVAQIGDTIKRTVAPDDIQEYVRDLTGARSGPAHQEGLLHALSPYIASSRRLLENRAAVVALAREPRIAALSQFRMPADAVARLAQTHPAGFWEKFLSPGLDKANRDVYQTIFRELESANHLMSRLIAVGTSLTLAGVFGAIYAVKKNKAAANQ